MPADLKTRTPENNINKSNNVLSPKEQSFGDALEDEISSVFRDLHVSAFSKAARISRGITSVTLGINSSENEEQENLNSPKENNKACFSPAALHSSTPEKSKSGHSVNPEKLAEVRKKIENLSPISGHNKISLENGISYQKLIHDFDFQRKLTVDKVMRERIQNMYDTSKLIRDSLEHLKKTREQEAIARRVLLERKIIDDIHEQEVLNKPKREAEWAKDNLKEAQRIQERNQRVKEAEEEARKKSEIMLLKRKQIDQILFCLNKEYNQEYVTMLESMKTCKDKSALTELSAAQSKVLKECTGTCEKLLIKCKQGDVSVEDVESAKKLIETIKMINEIFSKEINRINEEFDSKKQEVADADIVEQNTTEKDSTLKSTSDSPSVSDLSDCFDARSLETYVNLKNFLKNWEKNIEPLMTDESLKKFRFSCQKAVNIPVNAISPVSGAHLSDKYIKLHNLLSGRNVEVGDVKITTTQHPLGIAYCKYLLAKKFVRQGDLTVSSKPDAAFSIAAVLASLWVDFPDFGQLVLAHFQSACPYLAPVFMPQVEGQSDEQYHRSLGYHYSHNGEVEKQDSFLKRMSGIMRVYAALLISNVRQPGKMNPLGLSEGWRWISALLNLEPKPDICATLLYDFLEIAGNEMFKAYGGQFKKLLAYICQEYFPKLEKVTPSSAGGPLVRLENFLQRILKEESIPPPHGVLPPNFW